METTTTELFWKLVHEKAQITPATEAQTFTRSFTPKEALWERFRTVKGETGTLISDFQVCGEALEEDLQDFENLEIEPRCHPLVLHDPALDLNWSNEAKTLQDTITRGKKPRFVKGGEGKEYGRNYIKNQFKSLDLSMERLRQVQVRQKLVAIDTDFPKQVPNLEELSVSGHALKTINNLPPKVICLNAHCNQITSWPSLPNYEIRHMGLSGNRIESLEALSHEVASQLVRLASLDLSSNRLTTIEMIGPLMHIPALQHLLLSGNPMCLLPDYRGRVVSSLRALETFDGSPVLEIERKETLVLQTGTEEGVPTQEEACGGGGGGGDGGDAVEHEEPAEPGTASAEAEDSEPKEPEIPLVDTKGTFLLSCQMTRMTGLKDPNEEPEPPEAPEDSNVFAEEDEEETEEMREFLFYQENPPEFFITLALPGRPPIQSRRVQWAEGGEIELEVNESVRMLATYEALQWLRFEGVTVALFEERLQLPEKRKPPRDQEDEGEEASPESEPPTPEPDLDENGEPIPPPRKYIVSRLAQAVVETKALAEFGSDVHVEMPLPQYDEAVDKLLPLNDREVEKALDHARHEEERAARAAQKEQEKAMRKHDHHKDTNKKSQDPGEGPQHLGGLGLPDKRKEDKEKKEKEKEEEEKRRQKALEKAEKEKVRAAKKAARKKAVIATLDLTIQLNPEEPIQDPEA